MIVILNRDEFYKNIYHGNYLIQKFFSVHSKTINILDGKEYILNNGIENYSENRLIMVSGSRLEDKLKHPVFNPAYNELFANSVHTLKKDNFLLETYGEELIDKVSKKEISFDTIIKQSFYNELFLDTILPDLKKQILIIKENWFVAGHSDYGIRDTNDYIHCVYDITGLKIDTVRNTINENLKKIEK